MRDLRKAKYYFKTGGMLKLTERSFNFLARSIKKLFINLILNNHRSNFILSSKELEHNSRTTYYLPNETIIPNTSIKEMAPLGGDPDVKFYPRPQLNFSQPFVTEVQNCLLTTKGHIVTDNRRLVSDSIKFDSEEVDETIINYLTENPRSIYKKRVITSQIVADESVDKAVVLSPSSDYYYLWIIEQMLKLRAVEKYERMTGSKVTILVPSGAPQFVWEMLDLIGYKNQSVQWNRRVCKINTAIVPSFPEPTPKGVRWLKKKVETEKTNKSESKKWIYISRQNARGRRVMNFEEISEVLEQFDVEIVRCEELSIKDQISLFRNVEGVIAPHGAGLTNIIWAESLSVVEIFNQTVQPPYYVISDMLGYEYRAISGESVGVYKKERHMDIKIDIEEFKSVLEQVIQ